jgi:hypothetical protein
MVEVRMNKMERLSGHKLKNIFSFLARNLNLEGIATNFEHETVYVWLPKVK